MAKRIWWGTWPGALALALLSVVLALPAAASGLIGLLIPDTGGAGVDFVVDDGAAFWQRTFGVIAVVALIVLPTLTLIWARRTWLGYVLLALGLSLLCGIIGLGLFGLV